MRLPLNATVTFAAGSRPWTSARSRTTNVMIGERGILRSATRGSGRAQGPLDVERGSLRIGARDARVRDVVWSTSTAN